MQLMHYVQLKPSSESSQKEMAEALFRFYAKSLRGFSWKLGFHVERIGEESFPVPGCPYVLWEALRGGWLRHFSVFMQICCLVSVKSGALISSYQYQLIVGSGKFDNHPSMRRSLLYSFLAHVQNVKHKMASFGPSSCHNRRPDVFEFHVWRAKQKYLWGQDTKLEVDLIQKPRRQENRNEGIISNIILRSRQMTSYGTVIAIRWRGCYLFFRCWWRGMEKRRITGLIHFILILT